MLANEFVLTEKIHHSLKSHLTSLSDLIKAIDVNSILSVVNRLLTASKDGRNIFVFGNGGSAATASHFANDLTVVDRNPAFRVFCLNNNMSLFSALANDHGYELVFVKQLIPLLQPKDIVLSFSASGNSTNCVNAFTYAKEHAAITIGVLGFRGGKMKTLSDSYIHIPVDDYFYVENLHLIVSHALVFAIKNMD